LNTLCIDVGAVLSTSEPTLVLEALVIRILLVEQMCLLRGALAAVLSREDDLAVVAELGQLDQLLSTARAVRPDVTVVSLDLLVGSGAGTVSWLTTAVPGSALLVLARSEVPAHVRRTIHPYVDGYIGGDVTPEQFARRVRRAAGVENVIRASGCDRAGIAGTVHRPIGSPLSPREHDVLAVAARGVPSTEVAAALHLSAGTVRNHISAILRKTGARNRLEAVRIAQEAGWL
jgi:two-component system response regulator DesR